MLPFEAPIEPEDEEEIDPFTELEIDSKPLAQRGADALDAFSEEEETIVSNTEFADPLDAFADDDDDEDDLATILSFEEEGAPAPSKSAPTPENSSESTYRLLLETVWIDDILDPSEVELLARKRGELGISFERHLQLVRDIIGG
ncbi:MAG: hypothetical protein QGG96_04460 [Candidatus Poseidoniaceae archaeon]|jgi:hypothetical protein|nr:hypothetical protein [Candidatus Poseidoniaceae archaeon]